MKWWVLRREVHSSWLIAWAALGCVVGVAIAPAVPVLSSIAWLLTGAALVLSALYWRRVWLIGLCILGGVSIGMWRGGIELENASPYQYLQGYQTEITGVVQEDADVTDQGLTALRLNNIVYDGRELPGVIWVSVAQGYEIQRSDRVTVRGMLQEGFGSFAAAIYRADIIKIERPVPGDVALRVRDWFAGYVRQVVPDPEASLGLGYLVGQRRSLPPELDTALQIAGLTHVVVASGYNLTILVRLARRLFARVSRFSALAAAGGMIVSFIAVTGMSPSMSRAGLVTGLSLLAWYYGRTFQPLVLLAIAAATTVLVRPSYAWGDVGWQLSFAAFIGVMVVAPLLQAYFFGRKKPGIIRQILGETIAAQLMTAPILIATFGFVSSVAIIANLLVLPLVPLAMLLTFLTGVCSFVWPWLGSVVAAPTTWLLDYMVRVSTWLSSQSWAVWEVEVNGWFVLAAYVVLGAMIVYLRRVTKLSLRETNIVE